MSEKDKSNSLYFYDEIQHDEMQKTISFELEHKCLRTWYLLNNIWTIFAAFVFLGDSGETVRFFAPIIVLGYYAIMLSCQVAYDLKASEKGVLDSLSRYQTGMTGWKYFIGVAQFVIPITAILSYIFGGFKDVIHHPVFFSVFFALSFAYDVITFICVKRNKKVMDSSADENENNE